MMYYDVFNYLGYMVWSRNQNLCGYHQIEHLKYVFLTYTSCLWSATLCIIYIYIYIIQYYIYMYCLVVSTPLKNISQLGWLFPIYGKIKNVPNHQLGIHMITYTFWVYHPSLLPLASKLGVGPLFANCDRENQNSSMMKVLRFSIEVYLILFVSGSLSHFNTFYGYCLEQISGSWWTNLNHQQNCMNPHVVIATAVFLLPPCAYQNGIPIYFPCLWHAWEEFYRDPLMAFYSHTTPISESPFFCMGRSGPCHVTNLKSCRLRMIPHPFTIIPLLVCGFNPSEKY